MTPLLPSLLEVGEVGIKLTHVAVTGAFRKRTGSQPTLDCCQGDPYLLGNSALRHPLLA